MKFTVSRADLLGVLKTASAASDRNATMPALQHVLLRVDGKRLTATGSDLSLTVAASCSVTGATDGAILAPLDLARLIALFPADALTVTVKGKSIEVKVGKRIDTSLVGLPASDFPKLPTVDVPASTMDAAPLREALAMAHPAVCTDETRFHLAGVAIDASAGSSRFVATDGHRLHLVETPIGFTTGTHIIPGTAVTALRSLLADAESVAIALDGQRIAATVGNATLIAKLIDAQYPPWRQVVPSADRTARASFDRSALRDAIRRCAEVDKGSNRGVVLKLAKDSGEARLVASSERGAYTEDVELGEEWLGADLSIGFNPRFAIEALDAAATDRVVATFGAPLDPIAFIGGSMTGVVMPMRVQ